MKKSLLLILFLIATLLVAPVQAVGTVVLTSASVGAGLVKYTIAWTSDAVGNVSSNANELRHIQRGYLRQVKIVPGSGATQPTSLYDVTLLDSNGIDWLTTAGADQSNTVGEIIPLNPALYHDALTPLDLVIANAGINKTGTVSIWIGQ